MDIRKLAIHLGMQDLVSLALQKREQSQMSMSEAEREVCAEYCIEKFAEMDKRLQELEKRVDRISKTEMLLI